MPSITKRLAPVPLRKAALYLSTHHAFWNTAKPSDHHICLNSPTVTQIRNRKKKGKEGNNYI